MPEVDLRIPGGQLGRASHLWDEATARVLVHTLRRNRALLAARGERGGPMDDVGAVPTEPTDAAGAGEPSSGPAPVDAPGAEESPSAAPAAPGAGAPSSRPAPPGRQPSQSGGLRGALRSVAGWAVDSAVHTTAAVTNTVTETVSGVAGTAARVTTGAAMATVKVADPALRATIRAIAGIALEELDLNAIVRDKVDIDAIAARIDLDPIIDRVDVDRVIGKVDLDSVVAKVDLNAAVSGVDLDAIIDRVDVGKVIDKVDIDAVVSTVDLNAVVDRLDMDAIIGRVDLAGIAQNVIDEIDLPQIIRDSTGSLGADAVQGVRSQSMHADDAVAGFVGRLLGRDRRAEPS